MDNVLQTPVRKTIQKSKKLLEEEDKECSPFQSSSYETKLRRFGYQPETRIILKRQGGPQSVYYKTRSPMGFHVYVDVSTDEDGVSFSHDDLTMEEDATGKQLEIPYSIKQGVYDDTLNGIIVCPEGICRVGKSGDSTKMENTSFTYRSFHSDKILQNRGSIIAYPIVLLGEIVANPILVLEHTTLVMSRIRRSAYNRIEESIKAFDRESKLNTNLFQNFVNQQTRIASDLSASLKELQNYQMENLSKDSFDQDVTFATQVEYNLTLRNDKTCHLLEMCSEIEKLTVKMREVSAHFEKTLESFDKNFNDVKVFYRKTQ